MCTVEISLDANFVIKKSHKFPELHLCGAELKLVNGTYKLVGEFNGVDKYLNGLFQILRFGDKCWSLELEYSHDVSGDVDLHRSHPLYYFESDSPMDHPLSTGWVPAYCLNIPRNVIIIPAPCILQLKHQNIEVETENE